MLTGGDNVTATFDPDPNEAGSRILPATYAGIVATLSNGDLITLGNAAGLTRLSRLEADGTVVWTRPLLYSSFGMVTSAGGTIYVTGQIAIYALDSDGKLLWSMPSAPPTHVIATFGEDVVAAAQTSTSVYSALDGSLEWSVPFVPQAVAASSNVLAMAAGNTIHRYAPDGTELLPSWTVPGGDGASSMSFDPAGNLVILGGANENGGTVSGPPTLSKLSPDGAVVFSSLLDSSGNVGSGQVLALASGQVAALREHFGGLDSSTLDQVELYDASGARQWWVQKGVGWTTGDTYQPFGFSAQLLAGPGPGFRVLGSYFSGDQVLETFTP